MKEYKKLLIDIITKGNERKDRTKIGTTSIFGASMRIDLTKGFPLLTTKKVPFKSVKSELLWFLAGSTDERTLASMHYGKPVEELVGKKTIWTANADAQGKDLGYLSTFTWF